MNGPEKDNIDGEEKIVVLLQSNIETLRTKSVIHRRRERLMSNQLEDATVAELASEVRLH